MRTIRFLVRGRTSSEPAGGSTGARIRGELTFDTFRSDNGPVFIAAGLRRFLEAADIGTLYNKPGAAWENGYAESFRGKLRDELLKAELFANLREAKVLAAAWQSDYNHRRPHSALGYQTPVAYAASCSAAAAADTVEPRPKPRQGRCPWTPDPSPPPLERSRHAKTRT